jgi:hypothetical protein
MGKKIRDDEKLMTIVVCGIFTLGLIILELVYGMFSQMNGFMWLAVIVLHILLGYCWFVVLKNMYDPNFDKWRGFNIGIAIVTIIVVLGHRSDKLGTIEFWKEVEKNKIENAAP